MFLVLYGCAVAAAPITDHECADKALMEQQLPAPHSCCGGQPSHKDCCPDHQCKVRTDDNTVEIVVYKELNPQFQLFDFLSAGEQFDQIISESSLRTGVVSYSWFKIRIHLYNRVLRI